VRKIANILEKGKETDHWKIKGPAFHADDKVAASTELPTAAVLSSYVQSLEKYIASTVIYAQAPLMDESHILTLKKLEGEHAFNAGTAFPLLPELNEAELLETLQGQGQDNFKPKLSGIMSPVRNQGPSPRRAAEFFEVMSAKCRTGRGPVQWLFTPGFGQRNRNLRDPDHGFYTAKHFVDKW